jgi:hypothetical protein
MEVTEKRLKYLKSKVSDELEEKYRHSFDRSATYRGNGVYEWANVFSTDTRELFLLGIIGIEGIKIRGGK